MDFPISYASRQLNSAERNYTTTECEGLGMIYAVKTFWHYLLSNKFMFFVDHQALLYLVNKPCKTGRMLGWFIILLEFDFTVVVKKGSTHQRVDHLSRFTNGESPKGIDDDLPDAYLFNIEMIPKWSEKYVSLMTIGKFNIPIPLREKRTLIQEIATLKILARRLYKDDQDAYALNHLRRHTILKLHTWQLATFIWLAIRLSKELFGQGFGGRPFVKRPTSM